MKLSEAAKFYDDLEAKVAEKKMSPIAIKKCCDALIALSKFTPLPLPYYLTCTWGGRVICQWRNGHHIFEFAASQWSNYTELSYRNKVSFTIYWEHLSPIPTEIADKLKFFAEN